jgi:fructokinase
MKAQIEEIARRYELRLVALTRGADGSALFSAGQWSELPSVPVTVKDTVGAGDAFTAAITLSLLRGVELDRMNRFAGQIASYVCSRAGATPPLPARLREEFFNEERVPGRPAPFAKTAAASRSYNEPAL